MSISGDFVGSLDGSDTPLRPRLNAKLIAQFFNLKERLIISHKAP
jgi:hypothetical protein